MKMMKPAVAVLSVFLLAGCATSSVIDASNASTPGGASVAVSKPFVANANTLALDSQLKTAYAGSQVQVLRVGNELKITYPSDVLFGVGGEAVLPEVQASLAPIVDVFKVYPHAKLRVDSFTDKSGSPEKNTVRAENRAQSVADYLISSGVPAASATLKGYGSNYPVMSNDTADGRAMNRRVVITISRIPAPQGAK